MLRLLPGTRRKSSTVSPWRMTPARLVLAGAICLLTAAGMAAGGETRGSIVAGGGPSGVSARTVRLVVGAVAGDPAGGFYVVDVGHQRVLRVDDQGILTPYAGTGGPGVGTGVNGEGIPAIDAVFDGMVGMVIGPRGDMFILESTYIHYFGEYWRTVRRVDAATGIITTVASDGAYGFGPEQCRDSYTSAGAAFSATVGPDDRLYIADWECNRIYRDGVLIAGDGVDGFGGDGGSALNASLSRPASPVVDSAGNVYFVDYLNVRIRRIDAATGIITTVAGNGVAGYSGDGGPATQAALVADGIALDGDGNLYFTDPYTNRVRRVSLHTGLISTAAGDGQFGYGGDGGPAIQARFAIPASISFDIAGNLLIADLFNGRVRRVDPRSGLIDTVAGGPDNAAIGDGLPARKVRLSEGYSGGINVVAGLAVDGAGDLYFVDRYDARVRKVDHLTGTVNTVAGTGATGYNGDQRPAQTASLFGPVGIAVDGAGNLYIADERDHRVRRIDAATGMIETIAGTGRLGRGPNGGLATQTDLNHPLSVAVDSVGNVYVGDRNGGLRIDASSGRVSRATPVGEYTVIDSHDDLLSAGYCCIYRFTSNGSFSIFAGTSNEEGFSGDGGPATLARFRSASGLAVDGAGNVYVADSGNHRIRRIDANTGIITTIAGTGVIGFAGDGGPASQARLYWPTRVAADSTGNLFIAEENSQRVRKIDATSGIISTFIGGAPRGDGGPALSAEMARPGDVAVDAQGNMFIADTDNHVVRRVDAGTGLIETMAGGGASAADGVLATEAALNFPAAVAVDSSGSLYIADTGNRRIRKVDARLGTITTVAGGGTGGTGGLATAAKLTEPTSVALDSRGNLFIATSCPAGICGNGVYRVDAATGVIDSISASLYIENVAVDAKDRVYLTGPGEGCVHRLDLSTGANETVAGTCLIPGVSSGDGGPATEAILSFPDDVAVDRAGNLYIATRAFRGNYENFSLVRRVDSVSGIIETVYSAIGYSIGVGVDAGGNVFVADTSNNRVIKLALGNAPPVARVSGGGVFECASPAGATVELDGSGSSDADSSLGTHDDIVSFDWFEDRGGLSERYLGSGESLRMDFGLGRHAVSLVVTDRAGATGVSELSVEVDDTRAPSLTIHSDPSVLWPPNHRMMPVMLVADAQDICDSAPLVRLESVVSSEADDAPGEGDGHTTGDVEIGGPGQANGEVRLRAERASTGGGRRYVIRYSAIDASGNQAVAEVGVSVPHDRGGSVAPRP